MRVCIDVTAAAKPRPTGIATYIRSLIRHLAEIDPESEYELCYRVSRRPRRPNLPPLPGANFRWRRRGAPFDWFRRPKEDVFHGTDVRIPEYRGPALVATVHDLFSVISGRFASAKFRKKKARYYRDAVNRAATIVAPSESTRRDLIEHLGADPDRVVVIHEGVETDPPPATEEQVARVRSEHGISARYILSVGSVNIRKNSAGLVRAFARVRERFGSETELVIVGAHSQPEETLEAIAEENVGDRVRLVGYAAEGAMPALYTGARAFALPSLYEGFGIPVLEAMAYGVPVVTSNVSSLPEIAGDAALLVDPEDVECLGDALLRAADDAGTREQLIARGRERVRGFTWGETARRTLDVYRQLAG